MVNTSIHVTAGFAGSLTPAGKRSPCKAIIICVAWFLSDAKDNEMVSGHSEHVSNETQKMPVGDLNGAKYYLVSGNKAY